MKLSTLALSTALAGVSIAYCSLYIEQMNLREAMAQLQAQNNVPNNAAPIKEPSPSVIARIAPANFLYTPPPAPSSLPKTKLQTVESAAYQLQEESLKKAIDTKYTVLFSILKLSGHSLESMRSLLVERERVLNSNTANYFTSDAEMKANNENQQALLSQIDSKISGLLKPDEYSKYELLKDSSYEQYQINDFYAGLSNKKDINEDKRNALLLSKLEQKRAFSELLESSATEINSASPSDRKVLAERFKESMHSYTENYLRVAKENLNEEQFAALRDTEQKQFEDVWQGVINGWTHD